MFNDYFVDGLNHGWFDTKKLYEFSLKDGSLELDDEPNPDGTPRSITQDELEGLVEKIGKTARL